MRLAVLFPGALGDLCLLAPALAATAARGDELRLSVQRSLAFVATLLVPTAVLGPPIDGARMATLFDGALDPGVAAWLAGADRVHAWLARADPAGSLSERFAARDIDVALHPVVRDDGPRHASEDYAAALGVGGPLPTLHATPPPSTAALRWHRPEAARLVVHPGAGAAAKVWSLDGFRRVAETWRTAGGDVSVLLGPADEGNAAVWNGVGHPPMVGLSLRDTAALLASAPTFLGNDSGVSHLAAALGRRGVVLFGPTRPERWRPLGGGFTIVSFRDRAAADVAREVSEQLGTPSASPA